MKKIIHLILLIPATCFIAILLTSCGSASADVIFKPELSYRSPNLDFTKVQAAAIMPVNCYSNEVPEITAQVNEGLASELKRSQTAWKILSYDEVLRKLNEAGFGRGYQNYIADLNTFVMAAGMTPNFTSETYKFFDDLKKEMNFQAILFTSYGYSTVTVMEHSTVSALLGGPSQVAVEKKKLSVTVVLYDLSTRRTWWVSKLSLQCDNNFSNSELSKKVIEGIANYFGKGDLRQL